jgi:hypothetical protein
MPPGCSCSDLSGAPSFCSCHWMPFAAEYRNMCQGPGVPPGPHMTSCSISHRNELPLPSVHTTRLPNREPQAGSGTDTPGSCRPAIRAATRSARVGFAAPG